MKRRNTRKNIHKSEKWLAEQVHSYITSISNEDTFAKNQSGLQICWGLTWLLSNYLNLDPLWLKKKRWLDGIINAHISLENFDTITVYGKMVWGLSEDPGGNQWIEPFESVIRVSRNKSRIAAYTLKFGDDQELSTKLIRFGFYPILNREEKPESPNGARESNRGLVSYHICRESTRNRKKIIFSTIPW